MTTDTTDDDTHRLTRRALLATVGLAAATGRASADTALGGNPSGSASAEYRHGAVSTAPPTVPPEGSEYVWSRRDGSEFKTADVSLPATFVANGTQFSLASDLATAKSNTTQTPWIAIGGDGSAVEPGETLPAVWSGDGVEFVAAGDLTTARNQHSGATPAVFMVGSGVGSGNDPGAVVSL